MFVRDSRALWGKKIPAAILQDMAARMVYSLCRSTSGGGSFMDKIVSFFQKTYIPAKKIVL